MAAKKTFALGSLLRDKSDLHRTEEEAASNLAAPPALAPTATLETDAMEAQVDPNELAHTPPPTRLAPADFVTLEPARTVTLKPHRQVAEAVISPVPTEDLRAQDRRRPGPKGRGLYKKRTIDLPIDLDEFVENARRNHIRPNGRPSTIYTHFIEDLIAAERNRRALQ
jgi:hypothetical protein